MKPLTTSAFDLPDRLSAKADPALIAGDEQHFAAVGGGRWEIFPERRFALGLSVQSGPKKEGEENFLLATLNL